MKKAVFMLLFILGLAAYAADTVEDVTAEGMAAINNGNIAKARDEALWDAERKAVEQGVGIYVSAETVVKNAQLIEDSIYSQSNGFVVPGSRVVLKESKDEFLYYVTIKATVKASDIADKLLLMGLIKKIGDPRIMVYLDGDQKVTEIAENMILQYLTDANYRIVDRAQVEKIRNTEKAKMMAEGNTKEAEMIAQQLGSDIIITGNMNGKLVTQEAHNISITSYKGNLSLKVIKVDNGEIVQSISENVTGPMALSVEEAAKRGLTKTVKDVMEGKAGDRKNGMIYYIGRALLQKPSIQLVITGIDNNTYTALGNYLKEERTIKKVFPREMSGSIGRIDIEYDRGPDKLKEVIEGAQDIKIVVTSYTRNKIEAKIVAPTVIEAKNIQNFNEFKGLVERVEKEKDITVTNKKYSNQIGTIEIFYAGDLMKFADKLSDKFDIIDISDSKVVIQKK